MATPLLFVSDIDGSLLDEETYGYDAALPALAAVAARGALLALASSKTRPEVTRLVRRMGVRSPLIVENGGALMIPPSVLCRPARGARWSGGYQVFRLGLPRRTMISALEEIGAETGARIQAFSSLSAAEIEGLTGLSRAGVRLARKREWDEPFLVDPEHAEAVAAAASRRGLTVTTGGRFHHLTGATDKGFALGLLLDLLAGDGRSYVTVGLGDSANDLSMLERVERPILIPSSEGTVDATLLARLPRAERAPLPGPAGWNTAVLAVLAGTQGGRRRCPNVLP